MKNQNIKFQPFHNGKGKMTFEQVKLHILNFIKCTYTNGSDIHKYIMEGVDKPYGKEPVHDTIIVYKDVEKKVMDEIMTNLEQKGLDLNYKGKI